MSYAVEFRDVSKAYGRRSIVKGLNLQVENHSFSVILGAPASGKSTVLRLLTGLEKPDSGTIWLRGENATTTPPGQRNIGYVPQSFALYPHYTVFDNIGYPLTLLGYAKSQVKPVVESAAEQLRITHLLKKKPDQCSGGEKQRVAIARGIVKNTNIFIMDDPLTGLDFKLRERLFDDLRQMKEDLNATFIYTTSDPLEALMLAEQVCILDGGHIVENGDLEAVYADPAHARTMALLGFPEANEYPGELTSDQRCHTALFDFDAALSAPIQDRIGVTVAVRPQDIVINPTADDSLLRCPAEITLVEDLGSELIIYLEAKGLSLVAVGRSSDYEDLTEGEAEIGIHPQRLYLYAQTDGRSIGRGAVHHV